MSVGLIISALVIFFVGNPNGYTEDVTEWNAWHLFDPIATYVFSVTALISTLPVIKSAYLLLMDSSPSNIKISSLKHEFEDIKGIQSVSEVNVWQLKPGKVLLLAHVTAKKGCKRAVLVGLTDITREKKIYHTAFEITEEEDVDEEQQVLKAHG